MLASSGHAYLGAALVFGLLAALVTVAGSVWLGYRRKPLRTGAVGLRLAIIQVSSYVLMELAERWIAGGSFDGFPLLLALGLVAQVAVALVAAAIIVLQARIGDQIRRLISETHKRVRRGLDRPCELRPVMQSQLLVLRPVRGPPQPHKI